MGSSTETTDAPADEGVVGAVTTALVLFARLVQVALSSVAMILVLGALVGGMNVLAAGVVMLVALVMLGFVGVFELVVRGVGRWS